MGDREQILREAGLLFTKDVLDGLKEWYAYTLQKKWKYVVFTVRRSYVTALIFEQITGQKMDAGHTEFLTDAALFLRCRELADAYRAYGAFPRILLCDDIIIHGRNMNHIIEGLQEELCRLLCDEFDEDKVKYALVRAIQIHVYIRNEESLLLRSQYMLRLHYIREEEPSFWRQVSFDLSSFIFRADITNACYVYTEHLPDAAMDRIKCRLTGEDGFIHTVYQRIEQYTKLIYLGTETKIKGVLSLRIIKNDFHDGYRVAPFVFLPNMEAGETDRLLDIILRKLPQEYGALFQEWKEQKGKRSFNEVVTLLLSDVMLKEFNAKYQIVPDAKEKEWELSKLARNYNQHGFEQTYGMLQALLGRDAESLFVMDDIEGILSMELPEERLVMHLDTAEETGHKCPGQFCPVLSKDDKRRIREKVEDYFYMRGRADEIAAYELLRQPYFPTAERSRRRARGCCFTLYELNAGYTKAESEYCMAYFLQMIDAGIGSLSSYAPNHVKVMGYAQFAKAGEQSLWIEPLRKYAYIALLSRMQGECQRRLRDMTEEIREFGQRMGWESSLADTLIGFVDELSSVGQTPMDWDGCYIRKVDGTKEEQLKLLDERSALYKAYVEFAKEKRSY